MFIGRKKELEKLKRLYKKTGFQLFVLYGKSGVGKSFLLEQFCKDKDTIFFTVQPKSSHANLENFSRQINSHYGEIQAPFAFWDNAFNFIAERQKDSRLVLVLDEISELASRDVMFMNVLQNSVFRVLKDSNIFLVLSSNDVNFVKNSLLANVTLLSQKVSGSLELGTYLTDSTVKELREEAAKISGGNSKPRMQIFSAEEILMREGEINDEMFKIISGSAVCYLNYGTEHEYVLGTLKENNTCGEYSLLTGEPGIYTVVAFSDVLVLRVGRDDFENFIEMNAKNSLDIMKQLARMLKVMKVNIDMLNHEI